MVKNKANLFSQLGDLRKDKEEDAVREEANQGASGAAKRKQTGKRSDPDYLQVGAYILKSTDKAVKRLLIDEDDMDFSDLVQSLLEKWVKEHPNYK
jgi:hypothetical protein